MGAQGRTWVGLGLACLAAMQVEALQVDFQASVDRTRVYQSDPIYLTLKITTDEIIGHMPTPELAPGDFDVEGPDISTQQQVNIVNSRIQATYIRKLKYALYPRRKGRITIGPARLKLGSKIYQTRAIEVEVVAGSKREIGIEDKLFVQVDSDREQAYVGQQVTLDYELYYGYQLYDVGFKEIPSFSGFWVKDLFVAQQLQARQEVVNGVRFNVASLRRTALFPTSAGLHRVEPLAISCEVSTRRRRRSLFDDFGFGRSTRPVVVRSRAVEIEVLPLPKEGQPVDFTGAVGRFSLQVLAQPRDLPVGDPVTLRVEIKGQGNMAKVRSPDLDGVEGFKAYDPKVEEREEVESGLYGGSRIFEYILIPERGGHLGIPAIRFAYFDPYLASYQIAQSTPVSIASRGTLATDEDPGYGLSRKDIQAVGQDIRHIKPDLQELEHQTLLYKSGGFWAFQGMMPLAFLGLLLYQRHKQRLEGDVAYARRRGAKGAASKRLEHSRELLREEDFTGFHAEIQRAITAFLADQLNSTAASLTSGETCAARLLERGVERKTIDMVVDLLAQCDFARFAPTPSTREDMARVQKQAGQIIASLERMT